MPSDKYSSLWISNSSINDFLNCPRLYYLRNIYKDKNTGNKINLTNPPLTLGQAVHEVLESLSSLPSEKRMETDLTSDLSKVWEKYTGEKGGFASKTEEEDYKERARQMLMRVSLHPGPIANKAIKLQSGRNNMPPNYLFSEKDNIILCGRIDWIEYEPDTNSVHIIDFKTGNNQEKEDSLQLPIYCLLVKNLQRRNIHKISYWYLTSEDGIRVMPMPDLLTSTEKIMETALRIKEARIAGIFKCPRNGCWHCKPYEAIISGQAQKVATRGYQDIYIL